MITSHELARELLDRPNGFITANYGDKEFYIDAYKRVITDNENGFLASETSVESIEDAIARAMKDKKYREKIEMGKKLINEKYSLQSVINKECELCSKIKKK